MGPGDRYVKWQLTADIIPTENPLGVGSCVYHPESEGDNQLAIIIEVEEDEKTCTLLDEKNGQCSPGCAMEKLCAYDGQLKFELHRMNVQGGGIIKCDRLSKILDKKIGLSMKWLTPVSESEEDEVDVDQQESLYTIPGVAHGLRGVKEKLDDTNRGGCWYFDPEQHPLDLSKVVKHYETRELRSKNVKMIEEGEDILEELNLVHQHSVMNSMGLLNEEFCRVLLSTPFHIFEELVIFILLVVQGGADLDADAVALLEELELDHPDWCHVFYSIIMAGLYLRQDEEWQQSTSKIESGRWASEGEDDLNLRFDLSLYRTINRVGEWYEDKQEYRAAIWCYTHNLKLVRDPNLTFPPSVRKEYLISQLCNIGLANKRMDNFVEASRYYEEAIIECSSEAHGSAFDRDLMKTLSHNAKLMQSESLEWFGSSGEITKWDASASGDDTDNTVSNKCQSCGTDGASKKCSACHLVSYCNVECQTQHWKKAHKLTCLGKMCGKPQNARTQSQNMRRRAWNE